MTGIHIRKMIGVGFGILSLASLLFLMPSQVEACSGGGRMPLTITLEEADLVVSASVYANQDGKDGVLRVHNYLLGEVGHIGLVISQPAGRRCQYIAAIPTVNYDEHIFFLVKQLDGSHYIIDFYSYENSDQVIHIAQQIDDVFIYEDMTEARLLEVIEADPRPPLDNPEFIPISSSPFLIYTEEQGLYLFPVSTYWHEQPFLLASNVKTFIFADKYIGYVTDTDIVALERRSNRQWVFERPPNMDCLQINCIDLTEDGQTLAVQLETGRIQICYLMESCSNAHSTFYLDGQGFHLAPDMDAIAVWHGDEIQVYSGIMFNRLNRYELPPLNQQTSIAIKGQSGVDFHQQAAWSPDSRWLAYTDADGLWLWDVYTQPPSLLIPSEDGLMPYAHAFSNSGRYLRVELGSEVFILDLRSDLRFPDGIISPDERELFVMNTINPQPTPAQLCDLRTGECPMINDEPVHIVGAYWFNNTINTMPDRYRLQCPNFGGFSAEEGYINCGATLGIQNIDQIRTIALGNMAIMQVGDYEITSDIWGPNANLEGILDSPIQALAWLP